MYRVYVDSRLAGGVRRNSRTTSYDALLNMFYVGIFGLVGGVHYDLCRVVQGTMRLGVL